MSIVLTSTINNYDVIFEGKSYTVSVAKEVQTYTKTMIPETHNYYTAIHDSDGVLVEGDLFNKIYTYFRSNM